MEHEAIILISGTLEKDLLTACRLRLPYEACGIVYGTKSGMHITAEGYFVIRNVSPSPADTFSFHPEDWISAYYQAQKNQRKIVGFFHTHPQGNSLPSRMDEQGSIPWGTYWIISFAGGNSELAVYKWVAPQQWTKLDIQRFP